MSGSLSLWRRLLERCSHRRRIPDVLWLQTLHVLPFLRPWPVDDLLRLRHLSEQFLGKKEFSAAGGLTISDAMAVSIAAQACLPVLRLGLTPYDAFVGIVVHPDEVVARRSVMDDDGIVHEYDEVLSGEAMEGGPVMLSWRDVEMSAEGSDCAYNVVIHEFAHVLDMGDGAPDGVPPLPSLAARREWMAVIDREFEAFRTAVDSGEETTLDPYGATSIDEFFAVASEAFFVTPVAMRHEHPALYAQFAGYYRQDPAQHWR